MNIYEYSGVNSQYICALQGHRSNYLCHGWRLERIPNMTGEDSNLAQPFQYLDHLASLWLLPAAIQLLAVGERWADIRCQYGPRMSHGKAATPRISHIQPHQSRPSQCQREAQGTCQKVDLGPR